jgi:tRNA (cmo5U34)-methyltransferase
MNSSESNKRLEIPTDWTFKNSSVANNFETHVREQLPFYELVTGAVAHLVRHYLTENGTLYDIGASTGNITRVLAETIKSRNIRAISIEESEEMANIFTGEGEFLLADARDFDYNPFDVGVLFLVLMFLPIPDREKLLEKLLDCVKPGGAVIVVDKIEAASGYLGTVLHRLALAGKVATGTSTDEIIQKELSLAGVQRPLREEELPSNAVEFFRFGSFAGWIIEG